MEIEAIMNKEYDVIIVGGRVAGAVVAAQLGQLGHRVLVLEKAHFPSDTLSTSFFRAPALRVFEKIGVLGRVASVAPRMEILWNYIDGHVLVDPVEAMEDHLRYFVSERRITLDWILYKRMKREPNVDIHTGAKVKDLIWQDGRVIGVRWSEANLAYEATAKVVVGADGFYSTLAQIIQPVYENYTPVQRFTYYAYFNDLDSFDVPTAEHHFVGNTIAYVFPTDGDLTMVAVSMPIRDFADFKKSPVNNLLAHLESLPLLVPRLRDAELASEVYGSGNVPSYQRMPYGPGWVLVGDAHQVLDPWSGMGIDHAATHADFLSDALNRYLNGDAEWQAAMSDYRENARGWSEKTYRRTTTFAGDLRPMTRAALERRGLIVNNLNIALPVYK
jgi:flavin-dependent dehydrogenase